MKPITLKKLLPTKKLTAIFTAIGGLLPEPVCILDTTGKALYGDPTVDYPAEKPLWLKETQLGIAKGGVGLSALVDLLNILLLTEYEKKALVGETLDAYNELTLLYQVAKEFSIGMTLEQVARLFVQYAGINIRSDNIWLMVLNEKSGDLEVLYAEGDPAEIRLNLKPGQGIAGAVFLSGEAEIVNDVSQDPRFVPGPVKISSLLCTPLKTGKKVIGVIHLSTREPYLYTARDLNLTYTLASQAASAIENASLYEELQKSESNYRSLYENAVEGIFRCTTDTRIISVNPSLPGILGYASPQDLLGSIEDLGTNTFVDAGQFAALRTILERELRVANFETRVYTKTRTIIWVSINAAVIRDEAGKARYIDGSLIDITERIKREKAEREKEILQHQSAEYKQLLHVLCHDLANPLANLKGFLEMLDANPSLYDSFAKYMKLSADNGLSIIDYVRKLSAIEENKLALVLERHNLKNMVDEAGYLLYQQFKHKGIQLNNHIDASHFVLVDRTSFVNSVVNNLLSNAIKFSFPGSVIDVDSVADNSMVVMTVTDYGIGMPPAILEAVFDLTKKTSREGTAGEIGVGFGMPLVKTFITAYGGTITLSSTEKTKHSTQHGTQIRMELKSA